MTPDQLAYADILQNVNTKKDAELFITHIDTLIEALFNTKTNVIKKIEEALPYESKKAILAYCDKKGITTTNTLLMQRLLQDIKVYTKELPIVSLRVAFEPRAESIQQIVDWFWQNYKKKILLEYTVDPKLVGGIVVTSNGLYKDLSVRKKIRDMFL